MAEIFGVVASVATLASEGLKLSNALYSYYKRAKNAEEDIKKISKDVKSTSAVLRQLEEILKQDAQLCTQDFYSSLSENVDDCKVLFRDIRVILFRSQKQSSGDDPQDNDNMRTKDRLKWSFSTETVTIFRNDLDRLKLDVGLKIGVIRYKREVHESQMAAHERKIARKENKDNVRIEKHNIEIRKLKLEVAQRRYQHLKKYTLTEKTTAGPSVTAGATEKNEHHKPPSKDLGPINTNHQSISKGVPTKSPMPMWKGKGRSESPNADAYPNTPAIRVPRVIDIDGTGAQTLNGDGAFMTAGEHQQGNHSEQVSDQGHDFESRKNEKAAEQGEGAPITENLPHGNLSSHVNREPLDNSVNQSRLPLVNGGSTPMASVKSRLAKLKPQPKPIAKSENADKGGPSVPSEAKPGPSANAARQRQPNEDAKPSGSSADDEILPSNHSNDPSDAESVHSSAVDKGNSSETTTDDSSEDGGDLESDLSLPSIEVHEGSPVTQTANSEQPHADRGDQQLHPQTPSTQPQGSTQPEQTQAGNVNQRSQHVSEDRNDLAFPTSTFSGVKTWLRKARHFGKRKDKTSKTKHLDSSSGSVSRNESPHPATRNERRNNGPPATNNERQPARRNPPREPFPPSLPTADSRLPSSSLFGPPIDGRTSFRPFEGPPYESRNVRDRLNYSVVPTYTAAQNTQTILELWQFRRYTSPQVQAKSWGNITRDYLPLDESELQKMVENFTKKKKKKKKSVAQSYASLTSYQQRQVSLLVYERYYSYHDYRRFQWTINAIETFPKKKSSAACDSMQIVLERRLAPGATDMPAYGGMPPMIQNFGPAPPPPPIAMGQNMNMGHERRPQGPPMMQQHLPHNAVPRRDNAGQYPAPRGSGSRQVSFIPPDDMEDDFFDSGSDSDSFRRRPEPKGRSTRLIPLNEPPSRHRSHSYSHGRTRGDRRSDASDSSLPSFERRRMSHPDEGGIELRRTDDKTRKSIESQAKKDAEKATESRRWRDAEQREMELKLGKEAQRKRVVEIEAKPAKSAEQREMELKLGKEMQRKIERHARSTPVRSKPSFERSRSRKTNSAPLRARKKSSEDSVDDLISRWTVEDDRDKVKSRR